MKKFILVIIMTLPVYIYAQDIIDPEPLGYSSTNSQLVQTEQNGFVFGWNWGSGKKMSEALNLSV